MKFGCVAVGIGTGYSPTAVDLAVFGIYASPTPGTGLDALETAIDAEIDSKDPVELRAYLVGGGQQLTETWLYQWRAA